MQRQLARSKLTWSAVYWLYAAVAFVLLLLVPGRLLQGPVADFIANVLMTPSAAEDFLAGNGPLVVDLMYRNLCLLLAASCVVGAGVVWLASRFFRQSQGH